MDQRLEIQRLKGELATQLKHIEDLFYLSEREEQALRQIMLRAARRHASLNIILTRGSQRSKVLFGEICQICAPFLAEIDDADMPAEMRAQIETYQERMREVLAKGRKKDEKEGQ